MNKFDIQHLDLYYGDFKALKDINLEIQEHGITAFIGPSGCGKSTLLRTLDRMNDLVEGCRIDGKILLDGKDIFGPDMDVFELRKRVGMVFQKPNPFPMSVYDNIAYGPRTHGIRSKAKLDELVERSLRGAAIWDELKDRLKKSALGLSGGQQQRLCIARALAVEPEVLLMDRAHHRPWTPSPPPRLRNWQWSSRTEYTIVMVTHNMQQAVRVSPTRQLSSCWERLWNTAKPSRCSPCPRTSAPRTTSQEGLVDMRTSILTVQLEQLNVELIRMGALCEEAISIASQEPCWSR